jgi:hypothetical protein
MWWTLSWLYMEANKYNIVVEYCNSSIQVCIFNQCNKGQWKKRAHVNGRSHSNPIHVSLISCLSSYKKFHNEFYHVLWLDLVRRRSSEIYLRKLLRLYFEKVKTKDVTFNQFRSSLDIGDFAKGTIKWTKKGTLRWWKYSFFKCKLVLIFYVYNFSVKLCFFQELATWFNLLIPLAIRMLDKHYTLKKLYGLKYRSWYWK